MQLRVAEARDLEAIVSVINAAFRQAESFLVDRDRIDLETVLQLSQRGTFLIADDLGCVCGCVYVEPRGDRSYLGLLSVDPQRQKSGLGSALMDAAEDYCAKAGSRFMDLRMVSVREELPAFYRRRGYVETGTGGNFRMPLPTSLLTDDLQGMCRQGSTRRHWPLAATAFVASLFSACQAR